MNYEEIAELAQKAGFQKDGFGIGVWDSQEFHNYTHLLLKEVIKFMNQEWYELNNAVHPEKETDRDIGFRVGQKSQTIYLAGKIKKHFEVE